MKLGDKVKTRHLSDFDKCFGLTPDDVGIVISCSVTSFGFVLVRFPDINHPDWYFDPCQLEVVQ